MTTSPSKNRTGLQVVGQQSPRHPTSSSGSGGSLLLEDEGELEEDDPCEELDGNTPDEELPQTDELLLESELLLDEEVSVDELLLDEESPLDDEPPLDEEPSPEELEGFAEDDVDEEELLLIELDELVEDDVDEEVEDDDPVDDDPWLEVLLGCNPLEELDHQPLEDDGQGLDELGKGPELLDQKEVDDDIRATLEENHRAHHYRGNKRFIWHNGFDF